MNLSCMDDNAPQPTTRGYKHSIHQFFKPQDVERIDRAVRFVHAVMGDNSLLIKYRLLKLALSSPDHEVAPMVVDETEVLRAIRAVLGRQSHAMAANQIPRKTARIRNADGEDEASTSRAAEARDARQAALNAWVDDYAEMSSECERDPEALGDRGKDLSVSHVFGIAAKQYSAAMLSNIRYHFRGYVCASLGLVLRSRVCTMQGVKSLEELPVADRKRWRRSFADCYDDVLLHRTGLSMKAPEALRATVERHRWRLVAQGRNMWIKTSTTHDAPSCTWGSCCG